jgi:aryl-alcohol dehydrogenase-like predicted oxidoreductase
VEQEKSGNQGFEPSKIGVGTYSLSGVYGSVDSDSIRKTLRRAHDLGITFFDTALGYGNAEEVVGEVIRDFRKDILLSTKVAGGAAGKTCTHENIVASCEKSLKNLNVDCIDLYSIHFDDGTSPVEEVVGAFEKLKKAGKIRFYGLGHVFLRRARRYLETGDFSTVMGELSAVSTGYYNNILPLVRSSGAGYLGFSVTGRGVLTGKVIGREALERGDIRHIDALFAGERLKSALRISEKMAETAKESKATPAQVAIRWVLNREAVKCAICGPSSVEHLEENFGAAGLRGDTDAFRALEEFIRQESESVTGNLRREVENILGSPSLGSDAIPNLVYAAENMGELGMVPDEDLIPVFKQLLGCLRGDTCDDVTVNQVKQALADLLPE